MSLGSSTEAQDRVFDGLDLNKRATSVLSELVNDTQETATGIAHTEQTMTLLPSAAEASVTSINLVTGDTLSVEFPGLEFKKDQ